MTQKRTPLRMCAMCRKQFSKRSLIRFVKTSDGEISIDDTGKKPGRGLYVCRSQDCIAQAQKGARLEKAAGVKITQELLGELTEKAAEGFGY